MYTTTSNLCSIIFSIVLFVYAEVIHAAPELLIRPGVADWVISEGQVAYSLEARRDVRMVTINVVNINGRVIYSETLFNLPSGSTGWQWTGVLSNGDVIEPGLYRVEATIEFRNGTVEQENAQLRVLPKGSVKPGVTQGFVPPTIKPYQPSYRISGNWSVLQRFDNETGDRFTETRLNTRYYDKGEHYVFDANLGFFRQSSGGENGDSSYAQYQYNWQNGGTDWVFRRSLGNFDDPLRLYADFRSQNDKTGGKLQHQFSTGKLTVLALEGRNPSVGVEHGSALRWQGNFTDDVSYGVSLTRRDTDNGQNGNTDNQAYGVDMGWQLNPSHKLTAQYVNTNSDSDDDTSSSDPVEGTGHGGRLTWHFQGESGIRGSLGYLDLSEDFNAAFSDPGNQVESNVKGPELTINVFKPQTNYNWLQDLAVGFRAFSYDRHTDEPQIEQFDVLTQAKIGPVRFNGNFRERDENGAKSTTLLLSEQHAWNEDWQGGLQYTRTRSTGSDTQRAYLSANTGSPRRNHSIGLELIRRVVRGSANGPVDEFGILARGRLSNFIYEGLARQTTNNEDDDINAFLRLSYEKQYLHRYTALAYLALGDRSSRSIADRIEVGVGVRF